tara:strand:+ start:442 stop:615 length:174 start_codon:yes stop_codon:yes gene_type:complete
MDKAKGHFTKPLTAKKMTETKVRINDMRDLRAIVWDRFVDGFRDKTARSAIPRPPLK